MDMMTGANIDRPLRESLSRIARRVTRFTSCPRGFLVVFSLAAPLQNGFAQDASKAMAQQTQNESREAKKARRVAVMVVLLESMSSYRGAEAVIVRRARSQPSDLILMLESAATPALLASAVATLTTARKVWGDTATENQVIRVTHREMPERWRREVERAGARTLARLRAKGPQAIAGVGTGRATDVYLPSRKMRDARGEHAEIMGSPRSVTQQPR